APPLRSNPSLKHSDDSENDTEERRERRRKRKKAQRQEEERGEGAAPVAQRGRALTPYAGGGGFNPSPGQNCKKKKEYKVLGCGSGR
uniref:Uncharacterized protein n=1 Tax=Otolemur garnettii TaxID=30611 RepID=H0XQ72_OTOGA